ncbi:MAG: CBS domain-containing protein [Desulfovibrio sp.]
MYVGLKMLTDFVTITPDTLVRDADKLMDESKLWMLLVMDGDKLLGFVRKEDLRAALPSAMTSLDRNECTYLLSKLTIADIYHKNMTTISPDTEIEAAADLMYSMNLAGLAVVSKAGKLLGYINRSIMLEVLAEEMGHGEGGSRLTIPVEDRQGVIYEITGIIANLKKNIISTATFTHDKQKMVVVRVATEDTSAIEEVLKERGYKLLGPEAFQNMWEDK